jgi:hypothetical protein
MHERMRFKGLEAKCFFLPLIIIFPLFFNESKKRDATMGTRIAYDRTLLRRCMLRKKGTLWYYDA